MSVWACERVVCVGLWQVKPMLLDSSHVHSGVVFFPIHFNLSEMILQSLHVFTLLFLLYTHSLMLQNWENFSHKLASMEQRTHTALKFGMACLTLKVQLPAFSRIIP